MRARRKILRLVLAIFTALALTAPRVWAQDKVKFPVGVGTKTVGTNMFWLAELARRGWEYYTANRIWHPNAEINLEGLKFTMQVYAEQINGPLPDPLKYIDPSYLQQAIRELGGR